MKENIPKISVIIPAYYSYSTLTDCLKFLKRQHFHDFEVILVDSGSTDKTIDIAESNGARIIRIPQEAFTFGYALNIGIKESQGSIIAIVSAHAIPANKFWLHRLVKPLREHDTAMVYGGQKGQGRPHCRV